MVKDKLAHAVPLEIQGAGGNQPLVLVDDQMLGLPAGLGHHTARLFHARQPAPFEKGRLSADEIVPLGRVDLLETVHHFDLQHSGGHSVHNPSAR